MKKSIFLFCLILVTFCLVSCSKLEGFIGNENYMEGVEYNGVSYTADSFFCANSVLLGRADNGAKIYSVGSFDSPKYIVIVGDDNAMCYIKDGVTVPTDGKVTKVLIDPEARRAYSFNLSGDEELNVIFELTKITGQKQNFTVENYYTDGNAFYYVYNESDVSTPENYGGYIALVNGQWIYSAPGEKLELKEDNTAVISGVVIEDEELIDRMCKTDLVKYIIE